MENKPSGNVFISYSHKDLDMLTSLKRHFAALKGEVEFWDDSKIYAGMKWKMEIENALKRAKIAVLFLSADFFNSTYIMEEELPYLLEAEREGLSILTVVLKPCLLEFYPQVSQFQAINDPSFTIVEMDEAEKEKVWTKLIKRINDLIK